MLRNLMFVALVILCYGCGKTMNNQAIKYHDDGRAKPIVAFVPLYDRSGAVMPWNLSDELSYTMQNRLLKKGNFYLSNPQEIEAITTNLTAAQNPFASEIEWIMTTFTNNEFVVFTELLKHEVIPKELKNSIIDKITPSCQLDMTVRVRVIDLRYDHPKVILQELVKQSHLIPKPSYELEEAQDKWKRKTYAVSPIGFAHMQLTKEIAKRIEDYILLAKTS